MKKFLIIFFAVFALFFITAWGYLQTMHAQKMMLSFMTQTFKEKTGHDLEIEALSFPLPYHWVAYNVRLKEGERLWLSIEEASLSFSFWELFHKDLALSHVALTHVNLLNLPSNHPPSSLSVDKNFWDLFPYSIKISHFHLNHLTVDPHVLDQTRLSHLLPLDLEGSLFFNPHVRLANMDFSLKRHAFNSASATRFHFSCQGSEQFIFNASMNENRQGLLSEAVNLSLPYQTHFSIEGKKTDKHLKGLFKFTFTEDAEPLSSSNRKIFGEFLCLDDGLIKIHSVQGNLGPLLLEDGILLASKNYKIQESSFKLNIPDTSKLNSHLKWPFQGTLKATALLTGTLINPVVNVKLSGENLKIHNEPLDHLHAEADLSKTDYGLNGQALFDFQFRQTRFKAQSQFIWNEQQISLKDLRADYGSGQLAADIHYLLSTKIFEGKLDAFAEDSTIFQTLFDINLQGSALVGLKFYGLKAFDGLKPAQAVDFTIQADQARFNSIRVEHAVLSGVATGLFQQPNVDLTLKAKHAMYNGWRFKELIAETSIDDTKNFWPFHLSTHDSMEHELSIQAKGRWYLGPDELNVHLELMKGQLKKHPFYLQDPVTLSMNKESFDLSPFALTIDKGSFFTTVDYTKDQAHATARLYQIPLEIFYPPKFVMPFAGTISGEAYLFGTPGELRGQMHAQLSKIKILDEAFQHASPFDMALSGAISQTHIEGSAQITGVTQKPIEIKTNLPISICLNPPNVSVDDLAPFSTHVAAEGDLAPLLQLLVIDSSALSGKASVLLDVSGTFNDPHMSGDIKILDGTFESPDTEAFFHHLNAHLQAQDKMLVLKEFKARDLSDGILQGKGQLELTRESGFPFSFNLQLSKIRILNLDYAKATASGNLIIKGDSRKGKIQGRLITDSVQATVPEQISALAHSLDVHYINLPKGESSPLFTTSRPRWPLEMDIQIDVPKNGSIKTKDLSSMWNGSVKVQGMTHSPLVFGDFKIVKGDYHFNGQTFDIKEGTISFAGETDKKTTLYVIASKDLGKIVAEVILKGPVKNPLISFRSNPPMSQREILSWILFGRGTTDITPFQGAELSQSISNLSKPNQKPDVLSKIRDSFGLDRIDISKTEGNESNEVSVQVGKYISRGVLVKINKSITSETNQIGIEANLLPNIKAEAQIGDDSSTQLQLKWKKDY